MVTGDVQISSAGCSPRRRNRPVAVATTVSPWVTIASTNFSRRPCRATRVSIRTDASAAGRNRSTVKPGGLKIGIAGVAFEDVADEPAEVIAADRLTPRSARDRRGHEGIAIGCEEGRRRAAALRGSAALSCVVIGA